MSSSSEKLILRRPKVDDLPEIEDIARKYSDNPLPVKFVHAAVIEKDNNVISFGVIRSIIEDLLYTDGSDRDKVESLKQLIRKAKSDALSVNADAIYTFAESEEFAAILEKHFGFRRLTSIPMIMEL
jgi:hypothetical protein